MPDQQVLDWIRGRVGADAAMRRAASRRDAEPAPIDPEDDSPDAVDVLTRHHNQVDALIKQLNTIPGRSAGGSAEEQSSRKSIVDMITEHLSRHEAAEEELLWPAVRKALPDGDARADAALGQEQEGREFLAALAALSGAEEEFDEMAQQLASLAHRHVAFEDRVFLELRRAMSEHELRELGEKLRKAHKRAPTRPHPHAPQTPPAAAKATGAVVAAADRARDAVVGRPAKRKGRPGSEADGSGKGNG